MGLNLLVSKDGKTETIVFPKGHNFDKIFALAYKAQDSQAALNLLEKELNLFRKVKQKDPELLTTRIERKKIEKKIKTVQSLDVTQLPINITDGWLEVLKTKEDPTNIENFLIWLSLNDNENTRKNFLKSFSSKYPYITKNGFIVSVRSVWKEKATTDGLYEFIQSSYVKIKGQKKGPKGFAVVKNEEGYKLEKISDVSPVGAVGNLQDLFENYKAEGKTVYVSDYSKNYLKRSDGWTIGSVAEIHEKATHKEICGINQLHILSNPKDVVTGKNQGYGDTKLLVLVNPKDVINISEGWKYTTSRFYIAAEITPDEIDSMFTEQWGQFDYDYMNYDMKSIKEAAIEAKKDDLKADRKSLIESLKDERKGLILKNKTNHIEPELYTQILENRIQLIDK